MSRWTVGSGSPSAVRDLRLGQLRAGAGEQPEDVEAAGERADGGFSPLKLPSACRMCENTPASRRRQPPTCRSEPTSRARSGPSSTCGSRCPTAAGSPRASGCPRTPSATRCPRSWTPCRTARATAPRRGDAAWNRYFAGHGYAGVRIDLRGSGDSDGLIDDEYSEQEAGRRRRGDRLARRAAVVRRRGRDDRRLVGRVRRAAGGARNPPALRGHRRRSTPPTTATPTTCTTSAAACWRPTCSTGRPAWPPTSASRPIPRSWATAGATRWRERLERDGAVGRDLARAPAPRRLLAPGLGLRALRRASPARCSRSAAGSDGYRDMVLRMLEHVARARCAG